MKSIEDELRAKIRVLIDEKNMFNELAERCFTLDLENATLRYRNAELEARLKMSEKYNG